MMTLVQLFYEFFKTGLFAIGGGLATTPFLREMGRSTHWFSDLELANMIAVSESTPGPLGVNMAAYVGHTVAGGLGVVVATLGLIAPSVLVILLVARVLQRFRQSPLVEGIFYGLRPASAGLIAAAGLGVGSMALLRTTHWSGWENALQMVNLPAVAIAVAVFVALQLKPLKKIHPVVYIALAALVGVVFQL